MAHAPRCSPWRGLFGGARSWASVLHRSAAGRSALVLLAVLLVALPGARAQEDAVERAARREAFVHSLTELRAAEALGRHFLDGRMDEVRDAFSEGLARRLPAERLRAQRDVLLEAGGGLRLMEAAEWVRPPDLGPRGERLARIPVTLNRGEVEMLLGWRGDLTEGTVEDFRLRALPSRGTGARAAPGTWGERPDAPYVDRQRFREVTRRLPGQGGALTAVLSIPREAETGARVPAVFVLPDLEAPELDGAIGPNPLQQDIAHGLASRGILVLRVELPPEAVYTEAFFEDSVRAARTLATTFGVDLERVHLLAQRESAFHAPAIAERLSGLRGIALLSPLGRGDGIGRLERLILLGPVSHGGREYLPGDPAIEDLRGILRSASEGSLPPREPLLGRPASWWELVADRTPLRRLPDFPGEVLVIMPREDPLRPEGMGERWRELGRRGERTRVEWLPGVTHWLVDVAGDGSPGERLLPGHVSGLVLDRLEAFFRHGD